MSTEKLFKLVFIIAKVVGGLTMFAGAILMWFTTAFRYGFYLWACGLVVCSLEGIYNFGCLVWDKIEEYM